MIGLRSYCRAGTDLAASITAAALVTEKSMRSSSEYRHASNTNSRSLAIAEGAAAGVWVSVSFVFGGADFPMEKIMKARTITAVLIETLYKRIVDSGVLTEQQQRGAGPLSEPSSLHTHTHVGLREWTHCCVCMRSCSHIPMHACRSVCTQTCILLCSHVCMHACKQHMYALRNVHMVYICLQCMHACIFPSNACSQ